jgi:hypothetical protein
MDPQPGDSVAVRICARFGGWQIFARTAYLVVDLGPARGDLFPSERTIHTKVCVFYR